ncbi:MAG: diphthine synthase [Candidatus Diapherotrites archaeon]|jgi:diphthine synthase|uniref:Diphthine synthase n=1 Tax=Candidatus Iainarchaeum sp. TaxID=3101447 RepID=A0A8T5GFB1_9ARCH|nr:diphthine synthase [Candidatus Diapherotrites archaeon]MBT7241304.1 diphthine synthase [Candidatus Diapherotrites archaeon]
MLYLVGIGLKPSHLTLEALDILKTCDQVFLESYTSEYAEGLNEELEKMIEKKFLVLGRVGVEQQFESAMLSAKKNDIALMIFGNALTATTHLQVLLDAKEAGIKYKVIPGISITNMVAESGLDEYKFGRTITLCYHEKGFEPESFYDQLLENQKIGLHTLALLDIKKDEKPERLMNCVEGIEILEKIKNKREDSYEFEYVALLGMSNEKQKMIVGKDNIIKSKEIKELYPQSLIITGKTNEKEREALEKLY